MYFMQLRSGLIIEKTSCYFRKEITKRYSPRTGKGKLYISWYFFSMLMGIYLPLFPTFWIYNFSLEQIFLLKKSKDIELFFSHFQ